MPISVIPVLEFEYKGDIENIKEYKSRYVSNLKKALKEPKLIENNIYNEFRYNENHLITCVINRQNCNEAINSLQNCDLVYDINYYNNDVFETVKMFRGIDRTELIEVFHNTKVDDSTFNVINKMGDHEFNSLYKFRNDNCVEIVNSGYVNNYSKYFWEDDLIIESKHFVDGKLSSWKKYKYINNEIIEMIDKSSFSDKKFVYKYLSLLDNISNDNISIEIKENDTTSSIYLLFDDYGNVVRIVKYHGHNKKKYRWIVRDYKIEYKEKGANNRG